MNNEAIDLARSKRLPFRVMRGQVIDFAISVNNSDGTPYDFTDHTAEMYVYNSFSKTDSPEYEIDITLSSGSIQFNHAAITRKKEDFVYQLWITDADGYRQVWTNGDFLVLNREWDQEDGEDTLIISPDGDAITLVITPLGGSSVGLISGSSTQIPFINLTNNGFLYDPDLSFDEALNIFFAGSNFTITGSGTIDNITMLGTGHVIAGGVANIRWATLLGELNTIQSTGSGGIANSSILGGNSNTISTINNAMFNNIILGGSFNTITAPNGDVNSALAFGKFNDIKNTYAVAIGYRSDASGIGSIVFGGTPLYNETTIEKVLASGVHAVNISINSSSQTVGHGANANYSAILGGQDHNIPADSPGSVILGGNAIKARDSDPNQVYVPKLNIVSTPETDEALTNFLVRDETTGQVKRRIISDNIEITTVSATTYLVTQDDNGKYIKYTNSSDITITLPNSLSTGHFTNHIKKGTGNLIFVAAGTLESIGDTIEDQYAAALAIHEGSNVWGLYGKLT